MKAVIVSGGRHYSDMTHVFAVLDDINPDRVATGECPTGADHLAKAWAVSRGKEYRGYEAEWDRFGNAAGPIRNQDMLDAEMSLMGGDITLVAFPGNKGTADMIRRARKASVPVISAENPNAQ